MKAQLPLLSAVRVFETAARTGNFARAALELHITPAAVSQQMRNLEEQLGVRLFVRLARGVALTPGGAEYAEGIRAGLEQIRAATERLRAAERPDTLTLATTPSFAVKWLIPRLADFQERYPEIDVRLSTSNLLVNLASSDIDVAVRFGKGQWAGLRAELLLHTTQFPVCSPRLATPQRPLNVPDDLQQHTLLHLMNDEWPAWLTAAGVTQPFSERGTRFSDISMLMQAALEAQGVALGQSLIVADDLAAGRLIAPFEINLPSASSYYVVGIQGAFARPKVERFVGWLHAECARMGSVSP